MQFARGRDGGFEQYAVKLMFDRDDYALETSLYVDKAIAPVLPELKFATDNASANFRQDGYVFPPFMVRRRSMLQFASVADGSIRTMGILTLAVTG